MEKWYVAAKRADFSKWADEFHISPVLARIIRNRDITDSREIQKYLYGTMEDCYSPWLLHGMEQAVEILLRKTGEQIPIRVIGDYDVDGICSSYILTKGLRCLGAKVDTVIPHRIHDGYGLNDQLIEDAREDGIQMLLTCDNGIAAAPQIQRAIDYGMTVIVTDHHEVPFVEEGGIRREVLPPAHAVINPKQEQCGYPFPDICGGVVAYKLIQALAERDGGSKWIPVLEELLQFAALATICDVMVLRDENRIIVKEGLKRLRVTPNPGIRALMEVNTLDPNKLSAYHLGFVIGPCLNATGRLDTALRALELLECRTKAEAMVCARELKELNDSRKNLTLQGLQEAEEYLLQNRMEESKVLVIYLPQIHESLAGIIAGRIRERYNRPVFVLTKGEEGVKGSGRSIEAYHMYEAMTEVKQYFTKYGGHKLAAGLSMEEKYIDVLREQLNINCNLTDEDFLPQIHIDVPMPLGYADKKLAKELELLEPFGTGNPKPLFAQKELRLIHGWKMGVKKNCARFRVIAPEGSEHEMVYFGDLERFEGFLDGKYGSGSSERLYAGSCDFLVSVVYQVGINSYRGSENLQVVMQYYC